MMKPQMQQDMTPEEAKASLGLATRLQEQHLMSMMPPQEPQEAPGQEETPLREQYPNMQESMDDDGKFEEILDEITSIKNEIKQLLEEENSDNQKEDEEE